MAQSALRDISPTWWKDIKPQPAQRPVGQQIADVLGGVSLPLSGVPVIGEVAGLAADAAMYANYPEERTMLNAGMSLAGLLPFVPGAAGVRAAEKAAEGLDMSQAARSSKPTTELFDTPEFKGWWQSSKVVDETGSPRKVFHTTTKDFDQFEVGGGIAGRSATGGSGSSGPAIWLGTDAMNPQAAHNVLEGLRIGRFKEGAQTIPAYVSMQKPLIIDDSTREWARSVWGQEFPHLLTQDIVDDLARDYDGIMYYSPSYRVSKDKSIPSELTEIIAFRPNQVKSAITNTGSFAGPSITSGIMGGAVGLSALRSMNQQEEK